MLYKHKIPKTKVVLFPLQHIKISIQQLLRPNVSTHPLAAHVAFDQGEKVGNELVLDNLLFVIKRKPSFYIIKCS